MLKEEKESYGPSSSMLHLISGHLVTGDRYSTQNNFCKQGKVLIHKIGNFHGSSKIYLASSTSK